MIYLRIKNKKNLILILLLICAGIFFPLNQSQRVLLNNKADKPLFQKQGLGKRVEQQEFTPDWEDQKTQADQNRNGIDDQLEERIKEAVEFKSNVRTRYKLLSDDIFGIQNRDNEKLQLDNIPIIALFPEGGHSSSSLLFKTCGGIIKSTYDTMMNGFAGRISQSGLYEFCDSLEKYKIPFFIQEDRIYQAQLYYAGRNMNLRPYVWNTLSYDGDEYSSIAIVDTGVDDSHNFFSPGYSAGDFNYKIVGWRDEVNSLSSPYDDNGHGSHTSGIALGNGGPNYDGSGRSVATAAYNFNYTGYNLPEQSVTFNWTRFNVTDPGSIEINCEFDDFTPGPDDADFWVYLYYKNTLVDSYEVNSDSWSHTLSYTATSGTLGLYSWCFVTNLIDNTADSYVTDFDIRFRSEIHWPFDPPQFSAGDPWKGVAPDTHLVGVKVLDEHGGGWSSDIIDGINWVIANKNTYNITTMSLSLGGSAGDVAFINAVNNAVDNGIVTVVSAGNSGPGYNNIGSPGDADNVITVAAMSIDDKITDYSSQGGSSYTGSTIKPDITAPGGSFYNLQMFSADSNDNDAEGVYPVDGYANDLEGAQGTSMSAPAVAGAANLLIEAMGGHESWGYTATEAKRVKALLLISATETYPLLREGSSTFYSPELNRGGKDVHEGYGRLNIDVAIEAYTQELTLGSQTNALIKSSMVDSFAKHGLGCYVNLINGQYYVFTLDVPAGADFDLHLYSDNPSSIGEPVMVASSTSAGLGKDEVISFIPSSTGKYYLIAKAISGEGNAIISYPILTHELAVSIEVPSHPNLGDTYMINATVYNIGLNTENNVDLYLYKDGSVVNSINLASLTSGATYTISYIWNPDVFRTYNFSAYVPPVPGETILANNLVSKTAKVSYLSNYTMVPGYTYTWVDASGGTELFLSDDDYEAITLPFDFTFYNETFSTVYLCSNGYLSFTDLSPTQFSNVPFPSGDPSHFYMMAPFWDDLDVSYSGNVYVQSFGSYWVAEWLNVYHYDLYLVGSFEVILYETGEIVFNYDYLDYMSGYTCGLNLGVDTQYYNQYLGLSGATDNFSIQFTSIITDLDHDLDVSLDIPLWPYPKVGVATMIDATVINIGNYEEFNVNLRIYINDVIVESTTISSLPVDTSETISYMWTPPSLGTYNITAFAPRVVGEPYIDNNIKTQFIRIREITLFDGMQINYTFSIFGDDMPSEFLYSHAFENLYSVEWRVNYSQFIMYWDVDKQSRIMTGSGGDGLQFGSGFHTPMWIFTDVVIGERVMIAVDAEGDHIFEVTRDLTFNLAGFGKIEVWELEDLSHPGGIAWYEKSTGILLNGTFFYFTGGRYNYTFNFLGTNASFTKVGGNGTNVVPGYSLYMIIAILGILSIILVKRRFRRI